jgi:signal transduction histidine kinase
VGYPLLEFVIFVPFKSDYCLIHIRTVLLLVACLFLEIKLKAQSSGIKQVDSLEALIDKSNGTEKADALNALSFELFLYDYEKAAQKASEALALSEKLGYPKGMAQALSYMGVHERMAGNQTKALHLLHESVKYSRQSGDKSIQGYALVQVANFFVGQGYIDSASARFQQAYEVLKDSINPRQLSVLYKNWSKLFAFRVNHKKQEELLLKSLKIREAINDPQYLSDIYLNLASFYTGQRKFEVSEKYLNKADQIQSLQPGDLESLNEWKYQKAVWHFRQFNYSEALNLFNEVKLFYRKENIKQDYVTLLTDMAYIFSDLGAYELSLGNCYKGLKIAEENNFQYERAKLLWQTGWVYCMLKQLPLAHEFATKALSVAVHYQYKVEEATAYNLFGVIYNYKNNYDSALLYYNKALQLREELNDPVRIASTLNNIGTVLENQKRFKEALDYQMRSLELELQQSKVSIGVAWSYFSIGQLHFKLSDLINALKFLDLAEQQGKQLNAKQVLLDVFKAKAQVYEKQNDLVRSLAYYKLYDGVRDSLSNQELTNRIAGLQSEYTIQQKNQQIELLSKGKELKEAELSVQAGRVQQQRNIIVFGLVLLLIVVGASYFIYTNYQKVKSLNRTIQENSEEIQAQSEELQLSNQTIAQINEGLEQVVEARTKEVKQAYKELDTFFYRSSHDFRRPLTTFMGLAEVAKITVKDDAALSLFEKVNETARGLDKMLIKLQSISDVGSLQLIYKEIFMNEIFNAAADTFRDELKEKNIRLIIEVDSANPFFSYPALIKVVVENLVENALVFSEANQPVYLRATATEKGLAFEVEDNGCGIDPALQDRIFDMYFRGHERSKGNGLGLYIVKKVVEKLQGKVELHSQAGLGTVVKVFLPHQANLVESVQY